MVQVRWPVFVMDASWSGSALLAELVVMQLLKLILLSIGGPSQAKRTSPTITRCSVVTGWERELDEDLTERSVHLSHIFRLLGNEWFKLQLVPSLSVTGENQAITINQNHPRNKQEQLECTEARFHSFYYSCMLVMLCSHMFHCTS